MKRKRGKTEMPKRPDRFLVGGDREGNLVWGEDEFGDVSPMTLADAKKMLRREDESDWDDLVIYELVKVE